MNQKNKTTELETEDQNRQLGEEWVDWDGSIDNNPTSNPGLFIGLTIFAWILAGFWAMLSLYLIWPRLVQFGEWWGILAGIAILVIGGIGSVYLGLVFLSVAMKKPLLGPLQLRGLYKMLPAIVWMGSSIGFSRDKLAHSFLRLSNSLIHQQAIPAAKVLMILPRCLKRENMMIIRELCTNMGVKAFTVHGGSKARALIKEHRPQGIIGIACERDLLSGLIDIEGKIPIIAIPNQRPEGPCHNTCVDVIEVKDALHKMIKLAQ